MKHVNKFMGVTTEYDPIGNRNDLQKKAENGYITPIGYWRNLKAAWYQMTEEDKKEEIRKV